MKRSVYYLVLTVLLFALVIFGSANANAAKVMPKGLQIGTGTMGGGYYILGSAMGKVLEKDFGIPVTVSPSKGSGENIRLVDRGEIDIGLCGGQALFPASIGAAGFKEKKYTDLRIIMTVHQNAYVWVVLKGTPLKYLTDLKGKRVGMGTTRTAFGPSSGVIFRYHGFKWEGDPYMPTFTDFKEVYAGFSDLGAMLGDGRITTMLAPVTGGETPLPFVSALMAKKELVPLYFDEASLEPLFKETWMSPCKVKTGVFPGVEEFVAVDPAGGPGITVHDTMDEELVYKIVRALHENLETLAETAHYFKYPKEDPSFLVMDYRVPYHKGAIRYWKEVGLWEKHK